MNKNYCYVVYKQGVEGHGVYGASLDYDRAKEIAIECAGMERDNYHSFDVYRIAFDEAADSKYDGFMDEAPSFSVVKGHACRSF